MKINGLPPAGQGGEANKKNQAQPAGTPFDDFLKGALKGGQAAPASPLGAPMPLPAVSPVGQAQGASQAVNALENALGDLEMYQNALANPAVPDKNLRPMAQSLMASKDKLVSMLPSVQEKPLKDLISQTASLIISENNRVNSPAS